MASLESANVGKAVAARVGSNIRSVRSKLALTQAQLASPEFSISYISAIERGKIRPSLKALSILSKRLDVPLTFLLEGSPDGAELARSVGYSPADTGPDQRVEVDLLQATILLHQERGEQALALLTPLQPERLTTDQVYRLYVLLGRCHFDSKKYQEAVVDLRAAVSQAEALGEQELSERARNLLGEAYFSLSNYTLALENHRRCMQAIEAGLRADPFFTFTVFANLAGDYFCLDEGEQAVAHYQKAQQALEGLCLTPLSFASKYLEISLCYKKVGLVAHARDFALRSLALYEMREQQRQVGLIHLGLGKVLESQNDLVGAEREYRQAITEEQELDDVRSTVLCRMSLAELLLKRASPLEAEKEARETLEQARASGQVQVQGQAIFTLACVHLQGEQPDTADPLFTQALEVLDAAPSHTIAASAYFHYASILEARGDVPGSLKALKKAYEHQRMERGAAPEPL
jgi:tetratricopeptide (TPR) repeat protein